MKRAYILKYGTMKCYDISIHNTPAHDKRVMLRPIYTLRFNTNKENNLQNVCVGGGGVELGSLL